MRGIHKRFPGVHALNNVGLEVRAGEVHALMGQNGAGKSTLVKVLTGVHRRDAGTVLFAGRLLEAGSPADAQRHGIYTVYQEMKLVPTLSVAENLLLGRLPRRWFGVDGKAVRRRARARLAQFDLDLDVDRPLGSYPMTVQQRVAAARAVDADAQLLIFDEPTSSLDRHEADLLFERMQRLKQSGIGIVFITHFPAEVYRIADRITVLRNGRWVGTFDAARLPRTQLVAHMLGGVPRLCEQRPRAADVPRPGEPWHQSGGTAPEPSARRVPRLWSAFLACLTAPLRRLRRLRWTGPPILTTYQGTPGGSLRRLPLAPLGVLLGLLLFNCLCTPNFARLEGRDGRVFGSRVDVVQHGAPVLLLAVGMTLAVCVVQAPGFARLWKCGSATSAPRASAAAYVPTTWHSRFTSLHAGLLVLVLLYAGAALRYADEGFFSLRVLVNLLADHSFLGIVAVGMTFVILSGGIDLSVGAVTGLSGILIGVLIMEQGWPPWAAMLAALVLGALLGAGMGAVIQVLGIPAFIVTLAGMFFARGLGLVIHLESLGIEHPQHATLAAVGLPLGGGLSVPITALVFMAVVLAGAYVTRFTAFGRDLYALGGSEEAAGLMGLPVGRIRTAVYAVSGLCAALAGAVLTLDLSSGSHLEGVGLELDAIAAVVIGGTLLSGGIGSVFGTLVGVLVLGIILNGVTTCEGVISSGLTQVAMGVLLLGFVLLQQVLARGVSRIR